MKKIYIKRHFNRHNWNRTTSIGEISSLHTLLTGRAPWRGADYRRISDMAGFNNRLL